MVPLPYERECSGIKPVAVPHIVTTRCRQIDLHFLHRHRVVPHHRPSVNPGHRLHGRDTAHSSVVLEHYGIPVTVRSIHNGTLRHSVWTAVKLAPEYHPAFILPKKAVAAPAGLGADPPGRPVDFKDIVFSVDFVEMGPFGTKSVALRRSREKQGVDSAFFQRGAVRLKLGYHDVAVAVDAEKASFVKKKRCVMHELSLYLVLLPRTVFDVPGPEHICLVLVVCHKKHIIDPVIVAQGCRPLSHSVGMGTVPEIIDIVILQAVEDIIDCFPVDKVTGFHDRGPRTIVHRGADHIVSVADTDDVIVRYIGVGQRIDCNL